MNVPSHITSVCIFLVFSVPDITGLQKFWRSSPGNLILQIYLIFFTPLGRGQQKFKFLLNFVIAFSHNPPVAEIKFYSLYIADVQIVCYVDTVLTLQSYLMRHSKLTLRQWHTIRVPPLMSSVDFAECLQTSFWRQAHITVTLFRPFDLPNLDCVGNTLPGSRPVLTHCHGNNESRMLADV